MKNVTGFAVDRRRTLAPCRLIGLALGAAALLLAGCEMLPTPSNRFRDCATCPEMVRLPAGSYLMGSPAAEEGRDETDETLRQVGVGAFAAGVREVTFAQWDECVAGGGCGGYRPDDNGWGRGRRPVINVNWDDAQAYVEWLSRRTGREYRLLTEAEWEYAARAGAATPFHTGATITTNQANYDGRTPYGTGARGPYRARTVAAGSFAPNAFGLYDAHGNVAEMVADCYDPGAGGCAGRVVRGGSWGSGPHFVRSAYRSWCAPTLRNLHNGFRVARSLASV